MSSFRADIHCHSNCSDGSDTPLQILDLAHRSHLQGLSITDHDTVSAYSPEFFAKAESLSIEILPGVEISTELDSVTVHVLGYGFLWNDPIFIEFLRTIQTSRDARNRMILQRLASKKIIIEEQELVEWADPLDQKKSIGRPHIASLMVKKGYVRSMQEAFELYLKDGASCYVSGFKFTPLEAIEQIHRAKGKAVLAHPHFIKQQMLLQKLFQLPFNGIECYYATLRSGQEAPWVAIAKKKEWIATGGSDYHGSYKPHISLGSSWVDRAIFDALLLG
jgi:predicted metal-dependent phosphoesterase TrpH